MNLERMLQMCREGQWAIADLDCSHPPRAMSREEEETVVQLFTDMAAIERLAGALFVEQQRRAPNEVLRAIFETFVVDEIRHAHAAQMLADHYDVHHYRVYRTSPSLERFIRPFVDAIRLLDDDVANSYITAGELILDVALLRSINDYVKDETSQQAMRLINRDESRHIAVDYHMVEYYSSDAYEATKRRAKPRSVRDRVREARVFGEMLYRAKPFFRDVFFRPMDTIDPRGKRLTEAFRRFQLIGAKSEVKRRPFGRFLASLLAVYNHPLAGPVLGPIATRLSGVEPRFMQYLSTPEEIARASTMTFDALAREALAAKESTP